VTAKNIKKTLYNKTRKARYFIIDLIIKFLGPKFIQRPVFAIRIPDIPRPMVEAVKEKFGRKKLLGIEIGVAYGENAENILSLLNIKKLYLIDPYQPYTDPKCQDPRKILPQVKKSLARNNTVFIIKKSSEAINDVPEVDFVYIDGNHNYEFVKQDIELYYDKVRPGGIIGGHDFSAECLGVCKAVMEFAQKKNLKLNGRKEDWWIIKP